MKASAPDDRQISRGCQCCQRGKWLCIFLTYLCNANCSSCPAPWKQEDRTFSAFGGNLPTLSKYLQNSSIEGISFSGGESFLVFDRMIGWLTHLKDRFPHFYFWAYTNGIAVDEKRMVMLAHRGLDELRFNIAATGYDSVDILEKIRLAASIFDAVAVEIPSIPEDYPKLEPVLAALDGMNVRYLNLHEYIVVTHDANAAAHSRTFLMNKETEVRYDVRSLPNSERIRTYCRNNGLRLSINNCSLGRKEIQMQQRRLVMGRMLKQQHENLTDDGILETMFVSPQKLTASEARHLLSHGTMDGQRFIQPSTVDREFIEHHSGTIAKISLVPPMDISGERKLCHIQLINP